MKTIRCMFLVALASCAWLGRARAADSLAEVQTRMRERLPSLAALKEQKAVGENNLGYLEAMAGATLGDSDRKLVDAENADRKTVYGQIGVRTGADAELVGKKRAKQIAQEARPGIMIQGEKGDWYEKK